MREQEVTGFVDMQWGDAILHLNINSISDIRHVPDKLTRISLIGEDKAYVWIGLNANSAYSILKAALR